MTTTPTMAALIRMGDRLAPAHYALDEAQWDAMLATPPLWFIAHWCDDRRAYALFLERERPLMVSTECSDGRYLALSQTIPAAEWPERIAQDLWGAQPMFARNVQPLLDRDYWRHATPMAARPGPGGASPPCDPAQEPFDDVAGPSVLDTPGVPLGFAHRGLLQSLRGMRPEEALRLIGRVAAGGFVAHPLAYCRAVEQALGVRISPAGRDGRIILAEIERICVHLHDIATCATQSGAGLLATHAALAREHLADLAVEHGAARRLTDCVTPDGIAPDIAVSDLAKAVDEAMAPRMEHLLTLHRAFSDHLRDVATLTRHQIERFNIGGLAARAVGRAFDLRQHEEDPRHMAGRAGSLVKGDALAREILRLREIRDSLRRITRVAAEFGRDFVSEWPSDAPETSATSGEGIGAAEGAHGDIWFWVRLREGRIDAIHLRDPALSLAPVLPALLRAAPQMPVLASFGFSTAAAEL